MLGVCQLEAYYELVSEPPTDPDGHTYFGVWRSFACAAEWENTPAGEVWKDYVTGSWKMDEKWDSFLPNLDLARQFQSRFREHGYTFGIIAIYPCHSPETLSHIQDVPGYLGLDVATREPNSFLHPRTLWEIFDYATNECPLAVLCALSSEHFRSRVNQWGLLINYDDAVALQHVWQALHKLEEPDLPLDIHVLGIQEIASSGVHGGAPVPLRGN